MTQYFPTLYNDETLNSGIARCFEHMQQNDTNGSRDLFGIRKGTLIDVPNRLSRLADLIPCLDENELVFKHTLFHFYTAFDTRETKQKIIELMISDDEGKNIRRRAGVTGDVTPPSSLRFCPVCVGEDIDLNGEPYWHRIHQAAGVMACPTHGNLLLDSCGTCGEGFFFEQRKYIALPYRCSKGHELDKANGLLAYEDTLYRKIKDYAEDAQLLLDKQQWFNPEIVRNIYFVKAKEKGLLFASGKVDKKKLINNFCAFYGAEYLCLMQSDVNNYATNTNNCWLINLCRPTNRNRVQTLRHLLLIRFLYGSLYNFITEYNLYCSSIGSPTEDPKFFEGSHKKKAKSQKRSACQEIIQSTKEVSICLPVCDELKVATRFRSAKRTPWQQSTPIEDSNRNAQSKKYRVNWKERDQKLVYSIQLAIDEIRRMKPPVRVTRRRLEITANEQYNLVNNLDKLPRTRELVQKAVETYDVFRIRLADYGANGDCAEEICKEWFISLECVRKVKRSASADLFFFIQEGIGRLSKVLGILLRVFRGIIIQDKGIVWLIRLVTYKYSTGTHDRIGFFDFVAGVVSKLERDIFFNSKKLEHNQTQVGSTDNLDATNTKYIFKSVILRELKTAY